MLTFYSGCRMEDLADRLVQLLERYPLNNALASEAFVVQNHGMVRWLSTRIAEQSGIAANLHFQFPAERIWELFRIMDPAIPKQLPSDREPMAWTIYSLLEGLPDKEPFSPVWRYMRNDRGSWNPMKAWKLANQIADLFDQYLVYRPEMMLSWESGESDTGRLDAVEAWQAALWRRLNEQWSQDFTVIDANHRAHLQLDFMDALDSELLPAEKLPRRIILFGISGLPPAFIRVFIRLSKVVDIHWFHSNPTQSETFPDLQDSCGDPGKEFINMFRKFSEEEQVSVRTVTLDGIAAGEQGRSAPSNLDLFQRYDPGKGGQNEPKLSVQLHSCHSPLRETEVLHDRLLHLFDENPDLSPDDVLILTPDIRNYASFIEAVFGTPEDGVPTLPYHIVDDRSGRRKQVFETFARFLELLDSRFGVSEVLDFLSSRAVMERFGISEADLDRIHHWIDETRVRWGLSGEDKRQIDLPASPVHTWLFALDRMMLGYAARLDDELFEDIYPYDRIESGSDAELLGKLARFVNDLKHARLETGKSLPPEQWVQRIEEWIEAFIPSERDYNAAFRGLTGLAEGVRESSLLGGVEKPVPFTVILDCLKGKLTSEAGRGGYYGYGITFSGLDQMRNIPFRVIGMMGMNYEAFPRTRVSPEFDLMARNPRPGDRSRRKEDRYLFLETLNSAGKHFVLSYAGQSNRDDSSRPPSVLISELTDYMDWNAGEGQNGRPGLEMSIRKHPLHGYSPRYFKDKEKDLFSYSAVKYEVSKRLTGNSAKAVPFLDGTLPEADDSFRQVPVSDLVRFIENPSRYLLQERLGIYFREEESVQDEREPFEMKGLAGYLLGEELLARYLDGKELNDYERIARAKAMLPDGWVGRQAYREKQKQVTEFGEAVGSFLEAPELEPLEFSLNIKDYQLHGRLDRLHSQYRLIFRFGRPRAKDLGKLWISHLVLQLIHGIEHSRESLLIAREEGEPVQYRLSGLDSDHADNQLARLLQWYWRGIHSQTPFFCETSYSFAYEVCEKNRSNAEALARAGNAWFNPWKPGRNERDDPYIKLLFKEMNPIGSQEFIDYSMKFWRPVFENLNRKEERIA